MRLVLNIVVGVDTVGYDKLHLVSTDNLHYIHLMDPDHFTVVKKMFKEASGFSVNDKVIESLRMRLLSNKHPTIEQVILPIKNRFKNPQSPRNEANKLKYTGYFNEQTEMLTDSFFKEYQLRAEEKENNEKAKLNDEVEAEYVSGITVSESYTYDDVVNRLEKNKELLFNIPSGVKGSTYIDFNSDYVQYIDISNYTPCIHLSHVFKYYYHKCKCGHVTDSTFPLGSGARCLTSGCNAPLREDRRQRLKRSLYGSHISYNGGTLPILSLVDIQPGTSTAAVIVRTSDDDDDHYLFVVAVKQKTFVKSGLDLKYEKHVVWELVDLVDRTHLDKLHDCVRGLDYPKAAMTITTFANFCGSRSHNILFVGRSATGKSMLLKYYPHTICLSSAFQDSRTATNAGLIGSSETITINGQLTKMYNPGLLANVRLVALDEIYSNMDLYHELKTPLNHPELTKTVATTKFVVPKMGTVIASANINTSYLAQKRERVRKYREIWDSDTTRETFRTFKGTLSEDVYDTYGMFNDGDLCVKELIFAEEKVAGRNYVDGEDIATLERYSFLFYIGEDGKENPDRSKPSNQSGNKKRYTGEEIRSLTYSCDIEEYFKECAELKNSTTITASKEIANLMDDAYYRLIKHNRIHTMQRQGELIVELCELSAAINKRTVINEIDVLFVEDLLMHTCVYREPEQLVRRSFWDESISTSEYAELVKRISPKQLTVSNEGVRDFILRKSKKYKLFEDGVYHWDACVASIVQDVVQYCKYTKEEAVTHVNEFIAIHGGVPQIVQDVEAELGSIINAPVTDQSVEYMDCRPCSAADVFHDAPFDAGKIVLIDYLIDKFDECKTIPLSGFDSLVEKHGISKEVKDGAINYLVSDIAHVVRCGNVLKLKEQGVDLK